MKFKVATFNIQNKYHIKKYDGRVDDIDHVDDLTRFIKTLDIDILGVQELVLPFQKRLEEHLKDINYNITGKYRFRSIGHYIPFVSKFNESNAIITNHQIEKSSTLSLTKLTYLPRIATIIQIRINNNKLFVINSHLEVKNNRTKNRQLNKLLKIIKKIDDQVILMGDFNMTIKDSLFEEFLRKLNELDIILIPALESTHYSKKHAIDHIFTSKTLGKVVNVEVVTEQSMSDHKPVVLILEI